jgi:hypothetical protein
VKPLRFVAVSATAGRFAFAQHRERRGALDLHQIVTVTRWAEINEPSITVTNRPPCSTAVA